ncbi:MAG: magnesium transporter [Rikenellaceae bacterium]|nr:magnesium transporter [Rikenellaceae bacterium]
MTKDFKTQFRRHTIQGIRQLIEDKNWKELKSQLNEVDPLFLSEIIQQFNTDEQVVLFRLFSRQHAKEVFEDISPIEQQEIIKGLAEYRHILSNLLNDLDPDDRTAFFEELPGNLTQRLMQLLTPEEREITRNLLGYPEESIGRLMTPEYVAVKGHYTVAQTLQHIREFGRDSETMSVIYVVDDHWRLIDDIRIREILLAAPEQRISELINNKFVALNAFEDQEIAVKVFRDQDRIALPVVDSEGIMLGIVTVDDVLDVTTEESTEDFQKFGGTESLDLSYTQTSLWEMVKKRSGWLLILFVGEIFTASAMGFFEDRIAQAVVLALFVPLIISSGGNSGSQAASLIIRSLALGELKLSNWWYVMRKEILSGLLLGGLLGVVGFSRIALWQVAGFHDYGIYWVWVGLTVAVSLLFIVLWGTISGSMIPLILKKMGIDPATASAPFVATLVDVTGLVIYFSIALLMLSGKLL